MILADLGMHRAGIDRPRCHDRWLLSGWTGLMAAVSEGVASGGTGNVADVPCRIGVELALAARAAKEVRVSAMNGSVRRLCSNRHATNRVTPRRISRQCGIGLRQAIALYGHAAIRAVAPRCPEGCSTQGHTLLRMSVFRWLARVVHRDAPNLLDGPMPTPSRRPSDGRQIEAAAECQKCRSQ